MNPTSFHPRSSTNSITILGRSSTEDLLPVRDEQGRLIKTADSEKAEYLIKKRIIFSRAFCIHNSTVD
jgi:hypothetical protein